MLFQIILYLNYYIKSRFLCNRTECVFSSVRRTAQMLLQQLVSMPVRLSRRRFFLLLARAARMLRQAAGPPMRPAHRKSRLSAGKPGSQTAFSVLSLVCLNLRLII